MSQLLFIVLRIINWNVQPPIMFRLHRSIASWQEQMITSVVDDC